METRFRVLCRVDGRNNGKETLLVRLVFSSGVVLMGRDDILMIPVVRLGCCCFCVTTTTVATTMNLIDGLSTVVPNRIGEFSWTPWESRARWQRLVDVLVLDGTASLGLPWLLAYLRHMAVERRSKEAEFQEASSS